MRYLHPVAPHETFVASGTYRYEGTRLVEQWTIHELPDGAWFMRVDKDGRFADGRSELIEAWRSPAGVIERFDITAYGAPDDAIKKVKASYTVDEGVLYVGRTINDGERRQDELDLPEDYVLQPGGYVFFGLALPALVGRAPLAMVSRYGFTPQPDEAFKAGIMHPSLTYYGEGEVTVDGRARPARCYMAGERGAEDMKWHQYWIDAHDIFLKHEAPGLLVQLERYAHRP